MIVFFSKILDITSETQWQEVVALISERWQGLDALINNAGVVGASGDIDTFSIKDFQWTVDINLMGAVSEAVIIVCVPLLKERQRAPFQCCFYGRAITYGEHVGL